VLNEHGKIFMYSFLNACFFHVSIYKKSTLTLSIFSGPVSSLFYQFVNEQILSQNKSRIFMETTVNELCSWTCFNT
jgi:hypothetical protein